MQGLLGMILGALIVVYRPQIKKWVGAIPLLNYLGMGAPIYFCFYWG